MTPKKLEVLHVMACKWDVITCKYMHYMPLHAIEDANVELEVVTGSLRLSRSANVRVSVPSQLFTGPAASGPGQAGMASPFLSPKSQLT